MSSVTESDSGFYIFTWAIRNFSFCPNNRCLRSPLFMIRTCCDSEWELLIYPEEKYKVGGIGCELRSLSRLPITATWTISIVAADGLSYFAVERVSQKFFCDAASSIEHLVKRDDLFANAKFYLPDDTLTLRCEIKRCPVEKPINNRCNIRSEFKIQHIPVPWEINNFSGLQLKKPIKFPLSFNMEGAVQFEIQLYLEGNLLESSHVQIDIKKVISKCLKPSCSFSHGNSITMHCEAFLLNSESVPTLSVKGVRFFDSREGKASRSSCPSDVVWQLPESAKRIDLLANKNLNLRNDVLSLHFNITVSTGEMNSLPADVYTVFPESRCVQQPSTIKDDLKLLYQEQVLCDITLKTANKSFKAHKAVLACRSPVFKSMFEHDKAGSAARIVEISDVETEIFEQMLIFMYEDKLQDVVGPKSAIKLYCAAVIYQMNSLKEHCYPILKSIVSTENVCDVLALAYKYHDDKLKSIVKTFICKHPSETMESGAWERLMEVKESKPQVISAGAQTVTEEAVPLNAEPAESHTMPKKKLRRSLK